MSRMYTLSTRGGIPIRQTKLAPDGLEFSEDVSEARWVEERLSAFGTLRCCVFPSIRLCLSKTTCWSVTTPAPPIQYRMITFIDRQN